MYVRARAGRPYRARDILPATLIAPARFRPVNFYRAREIRWTIYTSRRHIPANNSPRSAVIMQIKRARCRLHGLLRRASHSHTFAGRDRRTYVFSPHVHAGLVDKLSC